MIEQKNQTWYIQRRSELAVQQFLLELEAIFAPVAQADLGFDFMAYFHKSDGTIVVVGVEVKATTRGIDGKFNVPSSQVKRLLKINIPILIIVVDVKENHLYFNWIKEAVSFPIGTQSSIVKLRTSTQEEREQLKKEIEAIK